MSRRFSHHRPSPSPRFFRPLPSAYFKFSLKQTLALVFSFLLVGFVLYAYFGPYFKISTLDCQLDSQPCPQEILDTLKAYQKQLIFIQKPQQIQAHLLKIHTELTDAQVSISLPHSLIFRLSSDQNLYSLTFIKAQISTAPSPTPTPTPTQISPSPEIDATQSATPTPTPLPTPHPLFSWLELINQPPTSYFQLNSQGQLIPASGSDTSIYIINNDLPSKQSLHTFFQLISYLNDSSFRPDLYLLLPDYIILKISSNFALFSANRDLPESLNTLQQIYTQSKIDLDQAIIDLRFNKPYISYY